MRNSFHIRPVANPSIVDRLEKSGSLVHCPPKQCPKFYFQTLKPSKIFTHERPVIKDGPSKIFTHERPVIEDGAEFSNLAFQRSKTLDLKSSGIIGPAVVGIENSAPSPVRICRGENFVALKIFFVRTMTFSY